MALSKELSQLASLLTINASGTSLTGNVGIGTSSPARPLDVFGYAQIQNPNGSKIAPVVLPKTPTLEIFGGDTNENNPGSIGLVTPGLNVTAGQVRGSELYFVSSRSTSAQLAALTYTAVAAGDNIGRIMFGGDNGVNLRAAGATIAGIAGSTWSATNAEGYLSFSTTALNATASGERMRLDSSGNLGIGTTSITDFSGQVLAVHAASGSAARIKLTTATSGTTSGDGGGIVYDTSNILQLINRESNGVISFSTQAIERMRLDSSGNLTLGAAAAGTNRVFNINGVANKAGRIVFQESGTDAWLIGNGAASENGNFEIYSATGNNFVFTRLGFLGIGTSSPSKTGHKALTINGALPVLEFSVADALTGYIYANTTQMAIDSGAKPILFYTSNVERMRLDVSGNLGIGTSSPIAKLDVGGALTDTVPATYGGTIRVNSATQTTTQAVGGIEFPVAGDGYGYKLQQISNNGANLVFASRSGSAAWTNRMTLDYAGNLGLGVTPSTWDGAYTSIQFPNGGALSGYKGSVAPIIGLTSNTYYNGGYKYVINGQATSYYQNQGVHSWWNAPAGTAGAALTFTQAMTLDASGNLGIGTTSPGAKLDVAGNIRQSVTSASIYQALLLNNFDGSGAGNRIDFSQGTSNIVGSIKSYYSGSWKLALGATSAGDSVILDASGNLGIGTNSPVTKLHITATSATSSQDLLTIDGGSTGFSGANDAGTGYSIVFNACAYPDAGSIAQRTGAAIQMLKSNTWNQSSGGAGTKASLVFKTNNGTIASPDLAERMRIDSTGNLGIGTTSPTSRLHAVSAGNTTAGSKSFQLTGGSDLGNAASMQYGLYVSQAGARYTDQTAIYGLAGQNAVGTTGTFSGQYYGVQGVVTVTSTATQKGSGVYGVNDVPIWNYNHLNAGVQGLATGGSTTWTAEYGISSTVGAFGGHFVSHGKASSIGVYADAYLDASPGAGAVAIPLLVASNGVEKMRLDASGNLGIGTTSPQVKLDVNGSVGTALTDAVRISSSISSGSATGGGLSFYNSNPSFLAQLAGIYPFTAGFSQKAGILIFATNNGTTYAEKMRLDDGGNLGIGTTSVAASQGQTAKLQVAGGIRATSGFTSSINVGTIAQNTTTSVTIPYNGLWVITNGANNTALILITLSGGAVGVQLVFSTNTTDVVCGGTSEPAGGTYLRIWMSASGGTLQVKNVNGYTGPYYMTPLATAGN